MVCKKSGTSYYPQDLFSNFTRWWDTIETTCCFWKMYTIICLTWFQNLWSRLMITQPRSLQRCTQIVRSFLVPCVCLISGGRHKGTAFPFHSHKTTASEWFQRRGFISPLVNYWAWDWCAISSSCWYYQWLTNRGFVLWILPS